MRYYRVLMELKLVYSPLYIVRTSVSQVQVQLKLIFRFLNQKIASNCYIIVDIHGSLP